MAEEKNINQIVEDFKKKMKMKKDPKINERNLKLQIESIHEGKKPLKCDICDAIFKHITTLHQSMMKGRKVLNVKFANLIFLHQNML